MRPELIQSTETSQNRTILKLFHELEELRISFQRAFRGTLLWKDSRILICPVEWHQIDYQVYSPLLIGELLSGKTIMTLSFRCEPMLCLKFGEVGLSSPNALFNYRKKIMNNISLNTAWVDYFDCCTFGIASNLYLDDSLLSPI